MKLVKFALLSLFCASLLLAGCSSDKGIKAPDKDKFQSSPADQRGQAVAPKIPPPPPNQ